MSKGAARKKELKKGNGKGMNKNVTMENTAKESLDLSQRLSEHFRLEEFVRSGTAISCGIDNLPSEREVENLRRLCREVLEPLRRRFGVIRITSGYRCQRLNRMVGGVSNSRHLQGRAADIHVSSMEVARKMVSFLKANTPCGELLLEHRPRTGARWIHVAL